MSKMTNNRARKRHDPPKASHKARKAAIEADLKLVDLVPRDYIWDGSSHALDDERVLELDDQPQALLDHYRENYPNEVNSEHAARRQSWNHNLPAHATRSS